MNLKEQVGRALKNARTKQGITMKELANKLGIADTSTISRYESGKLNLTLELIERFSEALDLKPEFVLSKK